MNKIRFKRFFRSFIMKICYQMHINCFGNFLKWFRLLNIYTAHPAKQRPSHPIFTILKPNSVRVDKNTLKKFGLSLVRKFEFGLILVYQYEFGKKV